MRRENYNDNLKTVYDIKFTNVIMDAIRDGGFNCLDNTKLEDNLNHIYRANVYGFESICYSYLHWETSVYDEANRILEEEPDMDVNHALSEASKRVLKFTRPYRPPINIMLWGNPEDLIALKVQQWAKGHRVAVCSFSCKDINSDILWGDTVIEEVDAWDSTHNRITRQQRARNTLNLKFDFLDKPLEEPNNYDFSILLLDDFNCANPNDQHIFKELISERAIQTGGLDEYFGRFLFTVAICHRTKPKDGFDGELNLSRSMANLFEHHEYCQNSNSSEAQLY